MKALIPLALAMTLLSAHADPLPDPTRPASYTNAHTVLATTEPTLRLEAIMRSGEKPLAIVNGKLVRVGDRIEGATIAGIDDKGVRYVVGGREHVAKLREGNLRVRRSPDGVTR